MFMKSLLSFDPPPPPPYSLSHLCLFFHFIYPFSHFWHISIIVYLQILRCFLVLLAIFAVGEWHRNFPLPTTISHLTLSLSALSFLV